MKVSLGLAALALLPLCGAHGHFEWVGVFDLKEDETYTLTAQADHGYKKEKLKAVVYPVTSADKSGIEAAHEAVDKLFHDTPLGKQSGDTIGISTSGVAVLLQFNPLSWLSPFYLHASEGGLYGIFAELDLLDFEKEFHYLQDGHGHDVEPVYEFPEPEAAGSWILAVGGTFLTTLPAVICVAIIGPGILQYGQAMTKTLPFASGAVGGVAVFLILPEASHMIPAWLWGTMVLLGWLSGVLIHHLTDLLTPHHDHPAELTEGDKGKGELEVELAAPSHPSEDGPVTTAPALASRGVVWKAALPILGGDAIHALVDGIVIGFSAKICGPARTWAIVFATIVHEVPVELSTLTILVLQAKMAWRQAALYNFVSAQLALVGAIMAYSADISEYFQGLCLAATGGIFLFIALTELAPNMLHSKTWTESSVALLLFTIGATLLALVLLDHEHCVGGDGGHHGGDHGHGH